MGFASLSTLQWPGMVSWAVGTTAVAHLAPMDDDTLVLPLGHETYSRAGPSAFAHLHELAKLAASTAAVSKKSFLETAIKK